MGSLMRPRRARPTRRAVADRGELDGLDPCEEIQLCRSWRATADRAALEALVAAHLGLVQRIANEFRKSGPEREDLIQEGHLGLVIAARRFDPAKSARLATYASYWIRACMMELVVRSHGAVRVGTTRAQRRIFFGLGRARREIEKQGTAATNEALAAQLGVDESELASMSARLSSRDLSLDAPRFDEGRPLGSAFQSDAPTAEEHLAQAEHEGHRRQALRAALDSLSPRERQIIQARHLDDDPPTLAELGAGLGISRERVRQLEERALEALRLSCDTNLAAG
jgi:RNA polymerase sigma-32 factor